MASADKPRDIEMDFQLIFLTMIMLWGGVMHGMSVDVTGHLQESVLLL